MGKVVYLCNIALNEENYNFEPGHIHQIAKVNGFDEELVKHKRKKTVEASDDFDSSTKKGRPLLSQL